MSFNKMMLHILSVGPMEANCYILGCGKTHSAMVIDPGSEAERILDVIKKHQLHPELIVNTHAHVDHIAANPELKEKTSALLCIHKADADMLVNPQRNLSFFIGEVVSSPAPDRLLEDGDILQAGTISLKVIHTPGHSPGSISLLGDKCIFTGDLLFAGGIGRYDFPGSSYEMLMNSLQKIMQLDGDLLVYPGHGHATIIGHERDTNPFLQG